MFIFCILSIKVNISRSLLDQSVFSEWCQQLNIFINKDIKLSSHIWYNHYVFDKQNNQINQKLLTVHKDYILVLCSYSSIQYYKFLFDQTGKSYYLWSLEDVVLKASQTPLIDRLLYAYSTLGGVLFLSYTQYSFLYSLYAHRGLLIILDIMEKKNILLTLCSILICVFLIIFRLCL